jgi:hypothetical protein
MTALPQEPAFGAPAPPGATIDYKELNGSLLLITVLGVEKDVATSLGAKDAIRADMVVLDGPNTGDEHPGTLIFPRVLQSQLRSKVGQRILGRLGQGTAKPGQSAPWLLNEADDGDKATAMAWLNRTVTAPAAPY